LNSAIEKLERYVRATGDRHTEVYIVDHLKIYASGSHSFLSSGKNLDDVLNEIGQLCEPGEDDEFADDHPDNYEIGASEDELRQWGSAYDPERIG
jgi:hypothetical protein